MANLLSWLKNEVTHAIPILGPLQDAQHRAQQVQQQSPQARQAAQNFQSRVNAGVNTAANVARPVATAAGYGINGAVSMLPQMQLLNRAIQTAHLVAPTLNIPQPSDLAAQSAHAAFQAPVRTSLAVGGQKQFTPSTPGQQFFLGNAPVKDFSGYGQQTAGGIGLKLPAPAATALGVALTAGDISPFSGGKAAVKGLQEASTATKAIKALNEAKTGLSAESIARIAPQVAKTKDENAIRSIIKDATAHDYAKSFNIPKSQAASELSSPKISDNTSVFRLADEQQKARAASVNPRSQAAYDAYAQGAKSVGAEVLSPSQLQQALGVGKRTKNTRQAIDLHVAGHGMAPPKVVPDLTPSNIKFPVSQLKVLESQGSAGKKLAQKTVDVQTTHDMLGAASESKIPTVLKIKKGAESHNFQDVLRGTAGPVNSKVARAVDEWKAFTPGFRDTAVKTGIKVGDRGPNYFPQITKFTGDNYQRAIDHLIHTGQARDAGEATKLLDELHSAPSVRKSGYFKQRTLDTGVNHHDVAAVARDYISRGAKTIAETQHYGKDLGKAEHLIGQIHAEGGDARKAREILHNIVSPQLDNSAGGKALRGARTVMAAAKLGTAVISHAAQPLLNDSTRAGLVPTVKAYATRYTKANRQLVKDTGVNYNIERQRQLEQSTGSRLSRITAPGLTSMQKFNRGVAAAAGKYRAQSLVKKASQGDVKATEFLRDKLGIKGEIGKQLTHEQVVQAGRNEAIATHFSNNPAELPLFHKSELGKTVMQFRAAYGIKQTGFIVNEVLKEAQKRNFAPLIRFAILAPIVGTGVYAGKAVVANVADDIFTWGKNQRSLLPGSVLEAAAKGGGFGLPGSIAEGFKYTKNSAGKLDATKVLEATAGAVAPLFGEGAKLAVNTVKALNGDTKPLVRQGVGEVPVVGGALANAVVPYQGSQPATGQPGGSGSTDLATQAANNAANKKAGQSGNVDQYLTQDQQNFIKLSPDQQKAYLSAHPEDAYLAKSADTKRAAEQIINGVKTNLPTNLDPGSASVITNYDRLSTTGKATYKDNPKNNYALSLANYNKDVAEGKLTPEQQYTKQQTLGKQKIESDYSQEVTQLYGFSKTKLADFFATNPDKQSLFSQVQQLSSKLADAGLTATDKFAKGLSSSRGGRKGTGRAKKIKFNTAGLKTAKLKKIALPKGIKVKKIAYKSPKAKVSVTKLPKIG